MMDELSRTINIQLKVERAYIPKAEYVFRTYCKILGLQPNFFYEYTREDIHVYYGPPAEERRPVEIYYSDKAAEIFGKESPVNEEIHFINYRNENIPFLFSERGQLFQYTDKSLEIKKDIIASAFFFLSCWQEYTMRDGNRNDKQDLNQTLQKLWNFEHIPVVDRYCDIFQKGLEKMLPGYQKEKKWYQSKDFAVSITQLLTQNQSNPVNVAEPSGKRGNKKQKKIEKPATPIYELIPASRFLKEFARQKKHGVIPELFFPYDYSLVQVNKDSSQNDPSSLPGLIHSLLEDKTIGIFSLQALTAEDIKKSAEQYAGEGFIVTGNYLFCFYQHYQFLFEILEETDLQYDISISYCDSLGYRAGISFPYYPFNIKDNRPFKVLEIPQNINNSVFSQIYHRRRKIKNQLDYMISDASIYRNHLGLIWSRYKTPENKYQKFSQYLKLLKSLQKKNAWICSPHEIYNHWINR